MPKINVTRQITVNVPANRVFDIVSNFEQWKPWSPWLIMEPEAKVTVAEDKKYYEWQGQRVGSGNMKITAEQTNKQVDYDLNFLTPWKSTAKVSFYLNDKDGQTEVTWDMHSSLPFFMFFMRKMIEGVIGMDYERGLAMLKEYAEDGRVSSKLEFLGKGRFDGLKYIGIRSETPFHTIGIQMMQDFDKLETFFQSHGNLANGTTFSQYHKWDIVRRRVQYTAGIGVTEFPSDLPDGFVKGELPKAPDYTLRHIGKYDYLGNPWSTVQSMVRNKEFKPLKKVHPFEIYVNNPQNTLSEDLITDIKFLIR